jgi:hypothetical protein
MVIPHQLVDPRDQNAVRNVNNVLTLYQMMINEDKAEEGTAEFLAPITFSIIR